jgi:hypothetical protein
MINLLPTLSRASLVGVLTGAISHIDVPQYLELGQGVNPALPSDETTSDPLNNIDGLYSRIHCTVQSYTTSTLNDTFRVTGSFYAGQQTSITNIGLFDVATSPPLGTLTTPVYTGDTQIKVSGYNNFPNSSLPFDIQIGSEVMTVVSGNGTNTWVVTRGSNGSPITYAGIPATSEIYGGSNTTNGNMFFKSSFSPIGLVPGESIEFIINIQFV